MERLVIIGGGFAGACIAEKLESHFDVILIDNKDYFEFTPSVLRTLVDPNHMATIQALHSRYLEKALFIRGCITDVQKHAVFIKDKEIPYDILIIASGSYYHSPFKQNEVVKATRASVLTETYERLNHAKSILIIGGGIVGVELAAEIADHHDGDKITLAHAMDRLMERGSPKVSAYAKRFFEKKGVKMIFNEFVRENPGGGYTTDKGRDINADLVFLCTG
ncbi:MAG: FAD-dependent oxidoreductase, partial [Nanoarchaeota archaeon]